MHDQPYRNPCCFSDKKHISAHTFIYVCVYAVGLLILKPHRWFNRVLQPWVVLYFDNHLPGNQSTGQLLPIYLRRINIASS